MRICFSFLIFGVNLLAVMSVVLWLLTEFEYPEAENSVVNLKANVRCYNARQGFRRDYQEHSTVAAGLKSGNSLKQGVGCCVSAASTAS